MRHKQNHVRITLITRLLLSSVAVLAAITLGGSANAAEYRAFWVDAWGSGFLSQSQVDNLLGVVGDPNSKGTIRNANCNMVIVQARRRFDVCYPSGVGEPYMSGLSPAGFNALAAMIKAAHDTTGGKKRVEVHCWSVAFKTGNGTVYSQHCGTPTGSLTTFDNYWPTRVSSTTGAENGDGAFDPGHPKCLEYLVNAHMDLVNFQTTAGPDGTDGSIDGIHYDYIRFEADTEGFNPTSVARYNARYGLTGDPASSSEQFKQWRRDQVSAFMRQMYARIQKTKPSVKQSCAGVTWNPSPATSSRASFQATRAYYQVYSDWDSWQQEGIVDMNVPMTYYNWASLPTDYTKWMNFEKDRKFNRHMIVGPGIYLNSLANATYELQMTRNASPAGNYADGFCGYCYKTPYSGGSWSGFSPSLVSSVTPTWDDIPDMPWKSAPTKGHMMGTVTIAGTGAWADFATVTVAGPATRSMMVDGTGFYAFIDLPPGTYTVTAFKPGYPNVVASVTVALGAVTGNMYEQNFVLGGTLPPSITAQPQDQSVSQGANATFTVTATGTAPLAYQWRLNAAPIAGATASTYTRSNVQPADEGSYSVVITNGTGSVTSSDAVLTVITNVIPPGIAAQPQSQAVIAGQSATFTVTATGTAPLGYQWRFNSAPIAGATGSAYTRASVQAAHAGSYSVVITNSAGSTNSANAVLTVNCLLTATAGNGGTVSKSPDQASYTANAVVTLTATTNTGYTFIGWSGDATGTVNPLSVTMTTNKTITANFGSTAPEIVIDNTDPGWSNTSPGGATWSTGSSTAVPKIGANYLYTAGTGGSSITRSCRWTPDLGVAGYYDVYVYYQIGPNRTAGATYRVTYNGGTVSSLQNQDSTEVNQGGWFLVGANLPFATGTGGYVELGNDAVDTDLVSADAAKFVYIGPVDTPPSITAQPQGQTVVAGASPTFSVTAAGTIPLSYQWRLNGAPIAGATGSSYTRSNAQPTDAGSYSVVVTNAAGTVTSDDALLIVNVPPAITTQPQNLTVNQGAGAVFTVVASGTAPLSYQWRFNDAPIAGATDSAYTRADAQPADAGSYSVVVTNIAGTVTSADATLAVNVPPAITAHPQDVTVNQGGNATFTVAATGTAPLAYQWYLGGMPIAEATGSAYTVTDAQPADAGSYTVEVLNVAGQVTSSSATLTVNVPPAITGQPQSLSVTAGSNVTFTVTATGTAPLHYQWRFNGADLAYGTSSSYLCNKAQTADAGSYSVVVSNMAGAVTSADAVLSVTQPAAPQIVGISLTSEGQIQLQVSGVPGHYVVEATTNLTVVDWVELTNMTTTEATFQCLDTEPNLAQRFYRVHLIP
ncbi:MAG TPA: immunoglobulin domain-containing protein [Candidatus Paceibacterota bacterium]|nr:immunoglobulin domain-containing protein [Verrucomicrobiota bacterium]HSA09665.1 immunoglobulin domain-containing protein [Candidatus Paceibacterota bacterium]